MNDANTIDSREDLDIAVIGMVGRFPGADNLEEFWRNLRDGVESITFFTDEELKACGVDPAALRAPNFVKAAPVLRGIEMFDAAFFGYSPREAELLDPQHRLFLECAWGALEDAGYDAGRYEGLIGVYGGTSLSTYLLYNLLASRQAAEDSFQLMIGNDKDFLSTRVSYKLNLRGPSLDVQTGCSTSLVAIHLACQALLSYHCDMALAGGVSVQVPQRTGYFYQEGGLNSSDGHCRAFDARAEGTLFGSGAGVVVLKRLGDALADGDSIQAVIKGSAINNDGSGKIGFTAPGVDGQAEVIAQAQAMANVEPETISYIEAHGTGTPLGDPVEIAALSKAFRAKTERKEFCAVGSVKSNIGHLDAAAGVAGLIKTVLSLKHKQLPPSLHFEEPNPRIDFADSPFYVNARLTEWKRNGTPRRAGVSSFGIGGTNAHVIVEEASSAALSSESRPWQLLMLSGKTSAALDAATAQLADLFGQRPETNLADTAYTLQVGRARFEYRRIALCQDTADARAVLTSSDSQRVFTAYQEQKERTVHFMFPGGGAQYVQMARDLYESEPLYREHFDLCAEILQRRFGYDVRRWLFVDAARAKEAAEQMKRTSVGLPALFVVEYALARLWMEWGIRPEAMIGHSLGEYVAACLSGVFSLEDALALVDLRGKLFEQLPRGGMLSLPLPEREVRPMLKGQLSLAAINGPAQCVVSGPVQAIEELAAELTEKEVEFRRIQIDVAAHSQMVEPLLQPFRRFVETLELHAPAIPFVSNVTGTWIKATEATDPDYWAQHLRQTVQFSEGLSRLLDEHDPVLLEVGPGQTLSALARLQMERAGSAAVLSSTRHPYDRQSDVAFLLTTLGKLWLNGVGVDWKSFYAREQRRRIPLPTYPFERQPFWIAPGKQSSGLGGFQQSLSKKNDLDEWFYLPSWKRTLAPRPVPVEKVGPRPGWLVLADDSRLSARFVERLEGAGYSVTRVRAGEQFERLSDSLYTINPQSAEDYKRLLEELSEAEATPKHVAHLWSLTPESQPASGEEFFAKVQEVGFYSLLYLAQAVGEQQAGEALRIWVLTNHLHEVESGDVIEPEKAPLLAPCKVIPQELENVTCSLIDFVIPEPGSGGEERLLDQLLTEVEATPSDFMVAYRRARRWVQQYERAPLPSEAAPLRSLRERGVYLITGGTGGIGLLLAQYLAETFRARLILVARSRLPERAEWPGWLEAHDAGEATSRTIRKIQALEESGAEVLLLAADVADEEQMQSVLAQTVERFGELHGVIHCAGLAGAKAIRFIPEVDRADCERHFQGKVYGLLVLEKVLQGRELDFCLLFSSNASVLGGLGSVAYTAANLFMDAWAQSRSQRGGTPWISANWDGWLMGEGDRLASAFETSLDQFAMTPMESVEAFGRVVCGAPAGQLVVSTGDLAERLSLWIRLDKEARSIDATDEETAAALHPRPSLGTAYAPPTDEVEQAVITIWQELLGIEQLGIHDNFFELGGNSLIGLKVIARLKRELKVEIPVVALFEGPTVSALAKVIGRNEEEKPVFEEALSRGERRRERRQQLA
ncbi:MAG TPA: SDR family NAD(P)-dependent oxidoreductase [Pyrinomonadaceae bacterium]|jgi:acyl transferase domain-containing protein/acyl carrier protein